NIGWEDDMKMEKLKNYGKSLLEIMGSVPKEIQKEVSDTGFSIMKKHLTPDELKHFAASLETEKEKMLKKDLSAVSDKGLNSEEFINQQIEWASSFSTTSKIIGREKTLKIFREMTEQTYPKLFFHMFPRPLDLNKFDDPFNAFKEWFSAMMEANKNVGLFDYTIVENTDNVFQMDCIWCAWHATYKQLEAEEACIPVCYADDAFYPDYFQQTDIEYKRTKTLGWGNACCDFRFERSVNLVF
ncbi:MAG: L-2-amino-thiazoline-4-carboxylic acid hydrolase, partial [Proteobacteria bacterium]|nr:L-2-amino-thiazoline-4-carboxylic acid hydrolase [Pseudomonadota bacterium]